MSSSTVLRSRQKSKDSLPPVARKSRSRNRLKVNDKSKSPSRVNQSSSKSRVTKVYTKKELTMSDANTSGGRMTRSKSSLLNKADEEKRKKIEDLKNDISNLVNPDNFAKQIGLDSSSTSIDSGVEVDSKLTPNHVDNEDGEGVVLRLRKKGAKAANTDEMIASSNEFKYSGYLKYKNKDIFKILFASILVVIFFFVISRSTTFSLF